MDVVTVANDGLEYLRVNWLTISLVFGAVIAALHFGLKIALKTKWTWDEKVLQFLLDLVVGLKDVLLGLVKGSTMTTARKKKTANDKRKKTVASL